MRQEVFIFGYSGHAFVVCDILLSQGLQPVGYLTKEPVEINPYKLEYSGFEDDPEALDKINNSLYFVAVGSNFIRKKITDKLLNEMNQKPCNAIASTATISANTNLGYGVMVGFASIINSGSIIGNGVICNTGSIVEHECDIGHFAHIAPGAILSGSVTIGDNSFIGAGAVIKEGIIIGKNVTVGAGTVVLKNIEDGQTVVGNPQRIIR